MLTLGKAWQEQVQQGDRDRNIEEIISFLLSLIQVNRQSVPVDQLAALQRMATDVEMKAFQTAKSHSNYRQYVDMSLNQIQAQCKEKQILKQQQRDQTNLRINLDESDVEAGKHSEDLPARIAVRQSLMVQSYLVFLSLFFLGTDHRYTCRRCNVTKMSSSFLSGRYSNQNDTDTSAAS